MNGNEKTFADLLLNSDNNVSDDNNNSNNSNEVSFKGLNKEETSNIFSVASEGVLSEKNSDNNVNFANIFESVKDEVKIDNQSIDNNNADYNSINNQFNINDVNDMVNLDNSNDNSYSDNQELNNVQVIDSKFEDVNVIEDNNNENIFNNVVNDNLFVDENNANNVSDDLEVESIEVNNDKVDNVFIDTAQNTEDIVDDFLDKDININNDVLSSDDIEITGKIVVDDSDFKVLENSNEIGSAQDNAVKVDNKIEESVDGDAKDTTNNIFMDVSDKDDDNVSSDKENGVLDDTTNPFVNQSVDEVVDNQTKVNVNGVNENDPSKNFVIASPLFSNEVINLVENETVTNAPQKIELDKTKNFEVKVVKKKDPLIKFVVGVISYAFFIWLLLIGVTLLVYVLDIKIRASKGDYSTPTFNAYVVLTGSMLPEIQVNDVVITKKVEPEKLDVGDIITFASTDSRFSGTIITHRIIKKNPATDDGQITFQTKGDNNNVADSALVVGSNIYGKVILKIPKLGYLQEFLATDGGWIIVILIPCLTVISYDIVKIVKGLKRKKYNNIKVKK